jgi:hypothetical protein
MSEFRQHLLSHKNLREVTIHYNGPSIQRVSKDKAFESGMWCTSIPGEFVAIEDILSAVNE